MTQIRIEDDQLWIDDTVYPDAKVYRADHDLGERDFVIHERRAHLHFDNGFTVSMIWGTGSHTTNRDRGMFSGAPFVEAMPHAEVAIIRPDGEILEWKEGSTVLGFFPVEKLAELFSVVEGFSTSPPEDLPDDEDDEGWDWR